MSKSIIALALLAAFTHAAPTPNDVAVVTAAPLDVDEIVPEAPEDDLVDALVEVRVLLAQNVLAEVCCDEAIVNDRHGGEGEDD